MSNQKRRRSVNDRIEAARPFLKFGDNETGGRLFIPVFVFRSVL
jgi:hypothetical protein